MGDDHNLYLKTGVLFLSDVFEEIRNICTDNYGLDPYHYFSSLGLSSDAMLKMTDIKLDLVSDIDIYQFIEKDMRGGVTYIAQ